MEGTGGAELDGDEVDMAAAMRRPVLWERGGERRESTQRDWGEQERDA